MFLMPGAPCRVGPPRAAPGASVAGRGGAVSISIKANSVARRAEFPPVLGRFTASSFASRAYWPEWRSLGTSGLVTGITVTR